MLLRRVIAHLRKQEWTAIAIDFLIVVLGVFLGLQVSDWNERRAEAAFARETLINIAADLRADEVQLSDGIRVAEASIEAANYALQRAGLAPVSDLRFSVGAVDISEVVHVPPPPAEMSPEDSRRLWSLSVVRYHPTQSTAAFDALMATGRLGVLRDNTLVRDLQAYRRVWDDVRTSQNETFRPFRNQVVFVGQKFGLSSFMEMPESEFVALLRNNPELAGALRTMAEAGALHRDQLQYALEQTRAMLARLDEAGAA